MVAPPADKVATFPAQTADEVDMATTGKAETVIVCVVEYVPQALLAVKV